MNLRATGVETFEMNCVARVDREAWRQSTVPTGMCRPSREIVFGHRALDFDSDLEFNQCIVVAFLSVGGEWFLMWQSKNWNGQDAAFRMFTVIGIVLLFLVQQDVEEQA